MSGRGDNEDTTVLPTTEATEPTQSTAPTQPSQDTQPPTETTEPTQSTAPTQNGDEVEKPIDLSLLVMVLKILSGTAALLALLWGQYRLRRNARNKRQHTGSPNARAIARWKELQLLCKLLKQEPEETILVLAEKARFSQHTLAKEELAQLQLALNAGQQLLLTKPLYQRLWIKLIWAL